MDRQYSQGNNVTIEVIGQNEGICKTGIPFPEGKLASLEQLKLYQNEKEVECFARPLCFWTDGSVKWVNLGFFHSVQDSNHYELTISDKLDSPQSINSPAEFQLQSTEQQTEKELSISTTAFRFIINLENLSLKLQSNYDQRHLLTIASLGGMLSRIDNQQATCNLSRWNSRTFQDLSNGSSNAIELELEGYFEHPTDKQQLRFTTIIEFYQSIPFIKIQTTLHNPNPAKHPEGLWDLGDEGSELFDSLAFNLDLAEGDKIHYQTSPNAEWQPAGSLSKIIQHASGGSNWQSPVHVDKNNQVIFKTNGFEASSDQNQISHGDRATPILHSKNGVGLTIEKFWQNFPTSIEINNNHIRVGLYPLVTTGHHELQGGEKKTHTFWLNFSNQPNSLDWVHSPPIAKPSNAWLANCAALPVFLPTTGKDSIADLITSGLDHTQNFFAKRETIDEYGWRHFGDLYADHETAGHEGKELFVSHYNNQYDPIYGFLKQFLLTGDARWFELADDLAKHVKDIDIYHTAEDKAEYNGGLFWHTDHYLKAYTSTHRSYSKLQENTAYKDRAGGGGPGGQHCYTTGLAYHYLLTGAEDSKLAVLTLARWITHVYEGTGTCLELLLAVKNRNVPGLKNQLSGQYPFDRGTANYVIALLDCYQLTQEQDYLLRVEHIIRNTVHPADNIATRTLNNIDECWFYIVFLQAICRYLQIKEITCSFDDAFYYARDALLHYADWMLAHEHPYLDKPEMLEFPNDTWTAQELRKTHVLAAAFFYSGGNKQAYLDKARYFQEYVVTRLSTSAELSYTRILALLMQNHGPFEYYASQQKTTDFAEPRKNWPKANYHQAPGLVIGLAKELGKRLTKLSIAKEIDWLKKRIGK